MQTFQRRIGKTTPETGGLLQKLPHASISLRRRSYLDPGTEVPVGYPIRLGYAFPVGGDPGRPYWFYGPDQHGVGGVILALWFHIPGLNPPNGP